MDKKFFILALLWIVIVVVIVVMTWMSNPKVADLVTLILSILTVLALGILKQRRPQSVLVNNLIKRLLHVIFLIVAFSGVHALVGLFDNTDLLTLIQIDALGNTLVFLTVLAVPHFLVAYAGGRLFADLRYPDACIAVLLSFVLIVAFSNQANFFESSDALNRIFACIVLMAIFACIVLLGVFVGKEDYHPSSMESSNQS